MFVRSRSMWSQQGPKLVGTGALGAEQGFSVALSADGNTALVGGPYGNHQLGAAWVFTRSGSTWSQQGPTLVGTAAARDALQGFSVALSADGNTALLGGWADNAAWVFVRSGSTWFQQGPKLVGTGASRNCGRGPAWRCRATGTRRWSATRTTTAKRGPRGFSSGRARPGLSRDRSSWAAAARTTCVMEGSRVALSDDGNTALIGGSWDSGRPARRGCSSGRARLGPSRDRSWSARAR